MKNSTKKCKFYNKRIKEYIQSIYVQFLIKRKLIIFTIKMI